MDKAQTTSVIMGVLYGIAIRLLVEFDFFDQGAMGAAFFFGTPAVMGAIAVYFSSEIKTPSVIYAIFFPWLTIVVFIITTFFTMLEGSICIALMSPAFLILASCGGLITRQVIKYVHEKRDISIKAFALLPLLFAAAENTIESPDLVHSISQVIEVNAEPSAVWQEIKHIENIAPHEFSNSLVYAIGVPYPEFGKYDESTQTRESRWQKNIRFTEYVIEHRENEFMRWTYDFQPGDIPPKALDEHVEIGGQFFDFIDTVYETKRLGPARTQLQLTMRYRLSTNFNWYSNFWAKLLVKDFEQQILRVYKNRAENVERIAFLEYQLPQNQEPRYQRSWVF